MSRVDMWASGLLRPVSLSVWMLRPCWHTCFCLQREACSYYLLNTRVITCGEWLIFTCALGKILIQDTLQISCLAVKYVIRCFVCEWLSLSIHCLFLCLLVQVVHLLFSWSSFLSWTLFLVDLLLIGFLSMHAYQDGESLLSGRWHHDRRHTGFMLTNISHISVDTLDHFEVPIFGRLANSFVDDEWTWMMSFATFWCICT